MLISPILIRLSIVTPGLLRKLYYFDETWETPNERKHFTRSIHN
jgi:hypothetical protein